MPFNRPINVKAKISKGSDADHCLSMCLEKRDDNGDIVLTYNHIDLNMSWISQQPHTVKGECFILKMLGVGRISDDCSFICENCPREMMGWSNKCVLEEKK